jgi:hypothetical protein
MSWASIACWNRCTPIFRPACLHSYLEMHSRSSQLVANSTSAHMIRWFALHWWTGCPCGPTPLLWQEEFWTCAELNAPRPFVQLNSETNVHARPRLRETSEWWSDLRVSASVSGEEDLGVVFAMLWTVEDIHTDIETYWLICTRSLWTSLARRSVVPARWLHQEGETAQWCRIPFQVTGRAALQAS